MKAVVVSGQAQIEELQLQEVSVPSIETNEVLVKVKAVSINQIDWMGPAYNMFSILGLQLPYTIGNDFSGIIEKVGENVTAFKVGDEVLGAPKLQKQGTYAQYLAVDTAQIVKKPASISFETAAAVPLTGQTALQAIDDHLKLQPGEKILIQAAAGGVGVFAVQLAKVRGAYVVAVGSEKNAEFLKSIGADEVFDYNNDFSTLKNSFDAVLDSMASADQTLQVLKAGGRYVSLTNPASAELAESLGVSVSNFLYNSNAPQLKEFVDLVEQGKVKVVIDRTFPFEDFISALLYQKAGRTRGKSVLTIG